MDTVADLHPTEQRKREIAHILERLEADDDAIGADEGAIGYYLSCLDDVAAVTLDADARRRLSALIAAAARDAARAAMMAALKPRLDVNLDGYYCWPE